ncbi:MAG: nuclear transport factor 2 family protein [Bacteroidales bacterium]
MKKLLLFSTLVMISFIVNAQNSNQNDKEIETIKKVIQTAYVEGLQNEGDFNKIDQGFHPDFELLIPGKNGELEKLTLNAWKERIKTKLASGEMPRKPENKVSIKFLFVDVTGNAAVAKFEFYVGTKLTFVDYQSLYKFDSGWKIVSKTYYKFE